MPDFCLTYARVVILQRVIKAEDDDAAWETAQEIETEQQLGLMTIEPKKDSTIRSIQDYDPIWEIEEVK